MKKEAWAITFSIYPDIKSIDETVYLTDEEYMKIPEKDKYHNKDYSEIISGYFTKEKLDEYRKILCDRIMNGNNIFLISENDLNGYAIDETKIWK